jgi:hypothetical protein
MVTLKPISKTPVERKEDLTPRRKVANKDMFFSLLCAFAALRDGF